MKIQIPPTSSMSSASTVAKIGRLIKKLTIVNLGSLASVSVIVDDGPSAAPGAAWNRLLGWGSHYGVR
jgi:hypothetical protein